MTINRRTAVLGVYDTISNKRKVVLDLLETIWGNSGGSILNTSREKCSSRPHTSVAWPTLARVICCGTLLLLGCRVYAQINLSGAYKRAITIDHTKVANTDQTNFPVLISGWFNGARSANGYDIIFASDPAGQHMLDHEIDTYNGKEEVASFWVRIPTLSHTSDTTIYMFYGIPGITTSQENKAGVWSNGYLSVYHFGDGGLTDSGSAGYTLAGSTSGGGGMINGGAGFNGDFGTYLYHDSVSAYPSGASPVTLEAWIQLAPGAVAPLSEDIVGYGENTVNGSRIALGVAPSAMFQEFENIGISGPMSYDNNWHHLVSVYSGGALSTATDPLYLDGVPLSTNLTGGTPAITTTQFKIGGIPTVTNYCCAFNGSVDEVRVSSVARSADWIATEYANQSSPSTFYSLGLQTGGPGGGSQGNLTCSPSILYAGGDTTCSVGLPSGATGQVTFSLDGQLNTTAAPNTLGLVEALVNLASASTNSHTITFSYPGDGVNPASNGSTIVTIQPTGSVLAGESYVYQFSITKPDGSSGYAPNGNVVGYMDSVNGSWSQISYDGLNRMISAQVTPALSGTQATSLCWSYDSFGNRTAQILSNQRITAAVDGSNCSPQLPATLSGTYRFYNPSNQIDHDVEAATGNNWGSPVNYDPSGSGNVIADGLTGGNPHAYLYDAEGRVCAVRLPPAIAGMPNPIIRYLYDAEGNRIGKETTTEWSCNGDGSDTSSLTNEYVVGLNGEQVTEFDGNGNRLHTNAYAGGQLIATYDNLGVHYQLADWLGTRRVQVSPAGALEETCQSLPFGDQLNCVQTSLTTANDATEHHFTGKERDTESGLDYFGARYYGSTMGRFMSPDWSAKAEPVPYAKLDNPQSLNLYAYVGNNPLSKTDPDGHLEAPWHFLITLAAALRTGNVFNAIPLAVKTVWVDLRRGSQGTDPTVTELHSTSGTTKNLVVENAAQAQEGTARLVDQPIAGERPKQDGLHAVEDTPAAKHRFGPWDGHLTFEHFITDLFPSPGTIKESFENAVSVLRGENPIPHTGETPPRSPEPQQEDQ